MKRSIGKQLKRLAAIALAAGMMTGTALSSWAAETATPSFAGENKTIDSADQTMNQEAAVWATVTDQPLKQLKVTLPIRLDFVVFKDSNVDAPNKSTQFLCGEYEIRVDGNSEVGVKLDKVNVTVPSGSKWDLIESKDVTGATDFHKVSIKLGDTELKKGDNDINDFTVGVGGYKELGMNGSVPNVKISSTTAAERAFQVTYTISQWSNKKDETPGA